MLDRKFVTECRKIALIVDNFPVHADVPGLQAINLIFLPPNTISRTQHMDQGVIRSLKAYYRSILVARKIACIEKNREVPKIDILDAMNMLSQAWFKVPERTVANCFCKAGICSESHEHDSDDPFQVQMMPLNCFAIKIQT